MPHSLHAQITLYIDSILRPGNHNTGSLDQTPRDAEEAAPEQPNIEMDVQLGDVRLRSGS